MKLIRKMLEVNEGQMAASKRYSEGIGGELSVLYKLRDPACEIVIEDFPPKTVTTRMGFWFSELQIILKGRAEIEYSTSTPTVGVWQKKKFVAEAGDAYLMDRGDQVSFRVLSDEPYRHLSIMMPAIPYSAPPEPENAP